MRTRLRVLATVATVIAGLLVAPAHASAAPAQSGCFLPDDPRFSAMRAMADKMVAEGQMSADLAAKYKCDPRLATTDMPVSVKVTPPASAVISGTQARALGLVVPNSVQCSDSGGFEADIGWPVELVFKSSLYWCWNGSTVEFGQWSGLCTGWTTNWGYVDGWSFQGCDSNDFIPYQLGSHNPGGVEHRAQGQFSNIVPWVNDYHQLIGIWGHYDGSLDWRVY